jgi:hypothetical protein
MGPGGLIAARAEQLVQLNQLTTLWLPEGHITTAPCILVHRQGQVLPVAMAQAQG